MYNDIFNSMGGLSEIFRTKNPNFHAILLKTIQKLVVHDLLTLGGEDHWNIGNQKVCEKSTPTR